MKHHLVTGSTLATLLGYHSVPATRSGKDTYDRLKRAIPLASNLVARYPAGADPHGQTGLAVRYTRRTTAHSGFFVRAAQSRPRYGRLCGDTFGCAGSEYRSANPVQPRHHGCLAAPGGGLSPLLGVTTMTTPAPNSSAHRTACLLATLLQAIPVGRRTGTVELQQHLLQAGFPLSLRSVQRHLNNLSCVLPIEADGCSPQGWRWARTPEAISLATRLGGAE